MLIEVKIPLLSESISQATLLEWNKKEGDPVERDENLIDVETDKVILETPAPQSGTLKQILKAEGASVGSEEVIAIIDTGNATVGEKKGSAKTLPPVAAPAAKAAPPQPKPEIKLAPQDAAQAPMAEQPAEFESPLALAKILGDRPEKRVPMTRLRARIAERLVEAQHSAAILTTFNEVNMQAVIALRNQYKEKFELKHGVKLGFMSFFVKASIAALQKYPIINASLDGQDIVYHGYYDIGIAVSSPRGLVVPIIRNGDQQSLAQLEKQLFDFGSKAKDAKLSMEDLTGGTFTLSNGGVFGSMMSTPILNPPQSAILGMHKIIERPIAQAGQVVICPMMYLALSYDHRLIDGRDAVLFLVEIKQILEEPSTLLLQM